MVLSVEPSSIIINSKLEYDCAYRRKTSESKALGFGKSSAIASKKALAIHSSALAWNIPKAEEPGSSFSPGNVRNELVILVRAGLVRTGGSSIASDSSG